MDPDATATADASKLDRGALLYGNAFRFDIMSRPTYNKNVNNFAIDCRLPCKILLVCVLLYGMVPVFAENDIWSSSFVGINWEFRGIWQGSIADSWRAIDSLALTGSYGNRALTGGLPLRARAGIGWWPSRPFMLTLGMELPLFELLSEARSRKIGVYLYADGHAYFSSSGVDVSFEPSLRLLVPLTALGGLAFGAGYDSRRGFVWRLESMGGAYILK